jgi:hypothetical protein
MTDQRKPESPDFASHYPNDLGDQPNRSNEYERDQFRPPWLHLICIGILVLAVRLLVIAMAPVLNDGDWLIVYSVIANNVLNNLCISASDPITAACAPSWGQNQPPGYGVFAALVWWFFPKTVLSILIAHSVALTSAIVFVCFAVSRCVQDRRAVIILGLVLAISPAIVAWIRFPLTETLATAAGLFVFGGGLLSFGYKKMQLWPIAIGYVVACFMRYDSILLAAPIFAMIVLAHGHRKCLRPLGIFLIVVSIPAALWMMRGQIVGLGPIPKIITPNDSANSYVRWGFTGTTSQYQYPEWWYGNTHKNYSAIRISDDMIYDDVEREKVKALLAKMVKYDGRDLPAHINEGFRSLLDRRASDFWFTHFVTFPARRALALWFNPYNSHGWPVSLNSNYKVDPAFADLPRPIALALQHPVAAIAKIGSTLWRAGFAVIFCVIFILLRNRLPREILFYLTAIGVYAIVRTVFFAYVGLIEVRYMAPLVPIIESGVVVALFSMWRRTRPSSP